MNYRPEKQDSYSSGKEKSRRQATYMLAASSYFLSAADPAFGLRICTLSDQVLRLLSVKCRELKAAWAVVLDKTNY